MQDFSHTEALHKYSYAEMVFTQEYIYTETVFHTILLQRGVFLHRRFYTQMLLHTVAFRLGRFQAEKLLHGRGWKHNLREDKQKMLRERCFYTQAL